MLRVGLPLIIASLAMAQVPYLGTCPNLQTMPNFDINRFLGKWYEYERYFLFLPLSGRCVTTYYIDNGYRTIRIIHKEMSLTGVTTSFEGFARSTDPTDASKFTVTIPGEPHCGNVSLWILDTDYDSYATMWTCFNHGRMSGRFAWILTKEQNPPDSVVRQAYRSIDKNHISRENFIRINQTNCPA